MNKKLIALALAALPAAAMADVTMYGIMKIGVENSSWDYGTGSHSQNKIDDYGSRLGFKGTEDLGDGLKAIWQVEAGIRLDGDQETTGKGTSFVTRDSFVGLDFGDFGKVRLGRLSTELNDPLSIIDFWEYDVGANGLGVFTRTGDRLNNAIRYDSADWYGFNFNAIYGAYEKKGTQPISAGSDIYKNGYVSGLGLNYQNSGFFASYGYEYRSDDFERTDSDGSFTGKYGSGYVHRVELGYNANNLFVGLGYQQTRLGGAPWSFGQDLYADVNLNNPAEAAMQEYFDKGGFKTKELAFSVGYTIGAFTPKFSYAHGWNVKLDGGARLEDGNGNEISSGYNQYVVGVDYALSKRTIAGLAWGYTKYDEAFGWNDDRTEHRDVKQSTIGLSLIHKF